MRKLSKMPTPKFNYVSSELHSNLYTINSQMGSIEEKLRGIKLRSRGFAPKLTDAELITMEIVGHLTHQNCTEWIYNYFKTHWQDWFPKLGSRANFMKRSSPGIG